MAKIKDKDRVLKAARERKKITYKGKPIRLSSDFSTETLQARGNGMMYLMQCNRRALNQEYCIQKYYHLNLKEGLNNSQISKN